MEPAPPIGLSYVATAAREAGHEVHFLDLMWSRDPRADLEKSLRTFRPDVVGISVRNIDNIIAQRTSRQLPEITALIATIRRQSRARIVLGGPAISILGKAALEPLDADFAIVGEGETAFPQLLSAIENNRDCANISGLCYRRNGKIISVAPVREEKFGRSGMENWICWRRYARAGGTWAIHTKRGCPLNCLYCNYPLIEGRQLRRRDAGDVADEIERVNAVIGPRTFEFTDSTFNVPESHAIGICEEIIRRKLRVTLSTVSINPIAVSAELFRLMKRAGFRYLVITPDSASEAMLENLRKGFDAERVRHTAELARQSGIHSTWFFLFGGPGETRQTVEETVSFVEKRLNSKQFLTIFLTGMRLLPGTPLTQLAMAEKYLPADADLSEPKFYFSSGVTENWILYRINKAIARCPSIVHGAEQNRSVEQILNRVLYWTGAAPPNYRFMPAFLRLPFIRKWRRRGSDVQPSCRNLPA